MGAPKGNQFWKLRSKHGRDKLFTTPELLWQAACEYFEWCENNPKIRLPKRARRDLSKDSNPGGGFFYVKDDKSLTLVKMFLGRTITKVETVIKV